MTTSKELKNKITLNGLVELFGFPTLPELLIDGLNLNAVPKACGPLGSALSGYSAPDFEFGW